MQTLTHLHACKTKGAFFFSAPLLLGKLLCALQKEMATHSSILAWRMPWTEEPGGYSPWGRKESDTTE